MQQFEFTAWSLYTGPSNLKNVIDDPNCPWVVGKWDGVNQDLSAEQIKRDIDERINILMASFMKIMPMYKTYNRHFVIPEFFFHCNQGPYPYIKVDGQNYPLEYIQLRIKKELQNAIPDDNNYYTFVIGSVLTSNVEDYNEFLNSDPVKERLNQLNEVLSVNSNMLKSTSFVKWHRSIPTNDGSLKSNNGDLPALNNFMKQCRANPLCTVRNRGIYFHYNRTMMPEVESYVYEKQNESTVDLTLGVLDANNKVQHGGMITEWMANYPSYSILNGDKQTDQFSTNARFTPAFLGNNDIGVEICLDHRLQRLRRTVDMTKINGAAADNFPLFKQIIPSGGMQILDYSVAADKSCAIFNADGCDKVYRKYGDESTVILDGKAGAFKGITCGVYNQSVQSKWQGKDGNTYYSHSQLAFSTNNSKIDGFNNALGLNNQKAITYEGTEISPSNVLTDSYKPVVVNLGSQTDLFGAGVGELHHYVSE